MVKYLSEISNELIALVAHVLQSTVAVSGEELDFTKTTLGSGWAYLQPGFVVTNHHVIRGLSGPIRIKPIGKPQIECQIIGVDEENDLALLFAKELTIPRLELSSYEPRLGQLCIGIGSPLGLQETASLGIISGVSRQATHPDGFVIEEMLQTDASINPGNSGGPLVDIDGLVLGVNTLGKSETVSFAVPAETVCCSISELAEYGHIRRAALGITIASDLRYLHDKLQSSVRIETVDRESSPLKPGDHLIRIQEITIKRRLDVQRALDRMCINKQIEIEVIRDGKAIRLSDTPRQKLTTR